MKALFTPFFRGLLFAVPIGATILVLIWAFDKLDALLDVEAWFGWKIPGLGILVLFVIVSALGILSRIFLARWIADRIGALFHRLPGVQLIYDAVKDVIEALLGEKKMFDRPVLVTLEAPINGELLGFVTCDDLAWQFGEWFSVQRVGVTSLSRPGSDAYRRWHRAVLDYSGGEAPRQGAIWLTYYPNVMVEWYPHVLVVSTLIPEDVNRTTNVVEFYYPEEIVEFERGFVEAEQAAYMETAVEDDEIAERMDRGRFALMRQGIDDAGPYQSPMEDGMQHFHEFYRRLLAEEL